MAFFGRGASRERMSIIFKTTQSKWQNTVNIGKICARIHSSHGINAKLTSICRYSRLQFLTRGSASREKLKPLVTSNLGCFAIKFYGKW